MITIHRTMYASNRPRTSAVEERGYVYVNRLLGVALVVFALLFVRDGLRFFGVSLG